MGADYTHRRTFPRIHPHSLKRSAMKATRTHQVLGLVSKWVLAGWVVLAVSSARGDIIWTDWTSGTAGTNGSAIGNLHIGITDVAVNYSGEIYFIQTNGVGTNFWNPSAPYISATVPNAPPDADIIALSTASSHTIT